MFVRIVGCPYCMRGPARGENHH